MDKYYEAHIILGIMFAKTTLHVLGLMPYTLKKLLVASVQSRIENIMGVKINVDSIQMECKLQICSLSSCISDAIILVAISCFTGNKLCCL